MISSRAHEVDLAALEAVPRMVTVDVVEAEDRGEEAVRVIALLAPEVVTVVRATAKTPPKSHITARNRPALSPS